MAHGTGLAREQVRSRPLLGKVQGEDLPVGAERESQQAADPNSPNAEQRQNKPNTGSGASIGVEATGENPTGRTGGSGGAAVAGDRGVEGEGKGKSQGQTQAGIANKYVEEDIQSGVLPAESLVTGNAWSVSPRARARNPSKLADLIAKTNYLANNLYQNPTRDLTRYLNNWSPIIAALA